MSNEDFIPQELYTHTEMDEEIRVMGAEIERLGKLVDVLMAYHKSTVPVIHKSKKHYSSIGVI